MISSPYYPVYQIFSSRHWFLREEAQGGYKRETDDVRAVTLFHVQNDDYFATLASILRFYEEYLQVTGSTDPQLREIELKALSSIIKELLYLDKNYEIVPKYNKNIT